ncbi:MAG: DUF4292 domain-containing protein, partial [Bacteroidia bacterium]
MASCYSARKAEKPIVIKENRKLKEITADSLLMFINDSAFRAERISGKAEVETDIEGKSNSFDINIRARKDSAIWISISPLLGIEVMRILITQDSIKYLDRIHKKYQVTDYHFLNDLLRMNLDYEIIQGVLTGNLFSYKKNKFNSVYNDEDKYYILSTLGKRKLKRSLEEKDPNKPIIQDMWVSDSTFRITKLSIEDNKIDKTLLTDYDDFRPTNTGLFPFKSKTKIKAEKIINISIDYSKI